MTKEELLLEEENTWEVYYIIDLNIRKIAFRCDGIKELQDNLLHIKQNHPEQMQHIEIVKALKWQLKSVN